MTTKELIAELQRIDPEGNLPIFCGGEDTYFVERSPYYYDGMEFLIIHDEELKGKTYSPIGGTFLTEGDKIVIHTLGIETILCDHPDIPIDLSSFDTFSRQRHGQHIEKLRRIYREMNKRIEDNTWNKIPCDSFELLENPPSLTCNKCGMYEKDHIQKTPE